MNAGIRPRGINGCTLGAVVALIDDGDESNKSDCVTRQMPVSEVVTGITLDSRQVRPGDVYAALPGSRAHGADYVDDAVRSGALAVLTDPAGRARFGNLQLPIMVTAEPRALLGPVAALIYGYPGESLALLGVTGTNGKTTTTYLLDAVLRHAGQRTGLIGTVETRIGSHRVPSVRTTPESPDLHALFAAMRDERVQTCSMEISSQALAQHRVDAAVMHVAGWTNFSQDHLDLHGDMDAYLAAKELLLRPDHSRRAVIVVDDPGSRLAAERAEVPVVTLSADLDRHADWRVSRAITPGGGHDVTLVGEEVVSFHCPLPGDFNVMNAALAALMLHDLGLEWTHIVDGLRVVPGVPGRMERVSAQSGEGPLAVVDYAHTPAAIGSALRALIAAQGSRRGAIVVVLGAGGDRDRSKRHEMGKVAASLSDVVIVTDDNPRREVPEVIRAELLSGAREANHAEVLECEDRAYAIAEGLRRAGSSGVLLVAGKGHEQGQEVNDVIYPFDDRLTLANALTVAGYQPSKSSGDAL
ncbi:MAG: UDP-N-acetylmuramoyl-L-alanyl-D-glutamate--2,6-diaminopimelate ligase [Actinomycetota bacterium]